MSPKLEAVIKETFELIDEKVKRMKKNGVVVKDPTVMSLEDGVLVNYFDNWSKYNDLALSKVINVDASDLLSAKIFFIPEGGVIQGNNELIKTILCLEGEILIEEDFESRTFSKLSACDIKSEEYLVRGLKDSFVLLILRDF